jgi:hypothetical protein
VQFYSQALSRLEGVSRYDRRGFLGEANDPRSHGEGRKRAKARGVRFGRPRKLTPHQREEALRRQHAGETMADVARKAGCRCDAKDGRPQQARNEATATVSAARRLRMKSGALRSQITTQRLGQK